MKTPLCAAALLALAVSAEALTPSPAPLDPERSHFILLTDPSGRLNPRLILKAFGDGFTVRCRNEDDSIACLWLNKSGNVSVRLDWNALALGGKPVEAEDTVRMRDGGGRWRVVAAATAKSGNIQGAPKPSAATPLFAGYGVGLNPDGTLSAFLLKDAQDVAELRQKQAQQAAARRASKAAAVMSSQP